MPHGLVFYNTVCIEQRNCCNMDTCERILSEAAWKSTKKYSLCVEIFLKATFINSLQSSPKRIEFNNTRNFYSVLSKQLYNK